MAPPTTSFTGVHSFRLKYPQYSSFRNNVSSKGEWIELYKNRNELPTAKLRTWVLYYRDDGNNISSLSDSHNYRFYSKQNGLQLGWIWGFPLFNVGNTATNWPKWGSCIGDSNTNNNEKMLVDISVARNIIVLDFNGYNVDATINNISANSTDKIKDNIDTGTNKGFYLTLRLKSSVENELKDFRPVNTAGTADYGYATLVEYVYECDIIGPRDMLDFTLDYFLYLDGINTKLFGENLTINNRKYKLAYISDDDANTYHDNLKISIITGLGPSTEDNTVSNWTNTDRLMDTDGIYNDLIYNNSTTKLLRQVNPASGRTTVTKIIGGYYGEASIGNMTYANHIGYYGDNFGSGQFQTRMGSHGWNNNTTLKNKDSDNGVTRTDSIVNPTYNLNNILWCSLNSPRKTKVRIYGANGKNNYRFIDNYLDLNGNECSGGGYSRFPNTIDLPRNNLKPYYGSNSNPGNTIQYLKDFDNTVSQYFTDDTQRTLTDIVDNHFKVYYKLLVPPINSESYNIKYTFGKDSGSKVTFFRHAGMSGTANPSGTSSLNAKRDTEDIELIWKSSDIDSNNDITKKNIILCDVASGLSLHTTTPGITDISLNNTINEEVYDLSCNVFQVQIYNMIDGVEGQYSDITKYPENPYQEKTFRNDGIVSNAQQIDISSTPLGYEPFRYINTELPYIFSINYENDIKNAPLFVHPEGLNFNYCSTVANTDAVSVSINKDLKSTYLNNPENTKKIEFNSSKNLLVLTRNRINISTDIFFEQHTTKNYFDISTNIVQLKSLNNQSINFLKPFSLDLGNNLIPDYWRLYKPINNFFFANSTYDNSTLIEYNYQTTISQILEITSISVSFTDNLNRDDTGQIKYILLNSNENKLNISASTKIGLLSSENLIIDVQGIKYLDEQLDEHPGIIQLKCNNTDFNPFGSNRQNFIGDIAKIPRENGGVNLPTTNNTSGRFNMNIPFNEKLSKNNGLQQSTDMKIWNNLYEITINFWDDGEGGDSSYQNKDLNKMQINPQILKVLLVNIPSLEYIIPVNDEGYPDNSIKLNNTNTSFELNWKGFEFLQDDVNFNKTVEDGGKVGKKIEINWSIQRQSITTNEITTLVNGYTHPDLTFNVNGDEVIYTFIDKTVRIFDKYKYIISAVCKWTGVKELLLQDGIISQLSDEVTLPSFNITGFVTDEIFICKNNRFPYGRFNTTATNLKLYRPLLLRTVGQINHQNPPRKLGGDCSIVQKSRPNVLSNGGSNNNIYINTADQMTRKQTFKRLSTLRLNR